MIAAGTILQNRYVVERQIGEGGMGAVYVATDRRFGSTVAIKETFFDDPSLRKAFEREARLLNHLRHAALPRVSDHFEEGAGQFLVMEYIPGEDLSRMLKERGAAFPAGQVMGWADQLLDALDYLHTQQPPVVHRDIKPQNLKLGPRDQIALLDFGLAKGTPLQTRVTATGSVFGYSFNYAPIEQMQGTGTDPRSDLYSLVATLYHLLTAATPPDALTRATAVLNGEPDPLRPADEVNARVPSELARVLGRALSMSAAQRFASAGEMREALREAGRRAAHGAEATAHQTPAPQTNVLQGPPGASENDTRVFGEPATNRIPLAEAEALLEETALAENPNASTLAKTEVSREAASTRTGQAQPPNTAASPAVVRDDKTGARNDKAVARDDKSVVTRARASGAAPAAFIAARPGRGLSRRTLGLAAGVVIVALVAAAVYSFTRGGASSRPAPHQPTPQPAATEQLVPSAQPAQTAPPSPDSQSPEAKAAPATAAPPAPRHTPAATARGSKPQNEPAPTPTPEESRRATPATPPQSGTDADEDAFLHNRDHTPTGQEIQQWMAQHPRRARMMRQRMLEERRRRANQMPPQ